MGTSSKEEVKQESGEREVSQKARTLLGQDGAHPNHFADGEKVEGPPRVAKVCPLCFRGVEIEHAKDG